MIYGRPKVGKTTMCLKDAPKGKTAILSADQGLIGIDTAGFTVEEDMSSKNLNKLMNGSFIRSHERILLDTATALQASMLFEIGKGGGNSQAQYGVVNNAVAALVRTLRDEKKQTIVIAQEKLIMPGQGLGSDGKESWSPEDDDEDMTVMTTVDLSPGAASALTQMSDVIGRLYIAHVNGKPVRRLWLGPSSSIMAGARSKTYHGTPPYLKQPSITRLNQLLGWTR
jgi:hypothetical protein